MTVEEVEDALRKMKHKKTGAEDGLVAEMLKTGHRGLLVALSLLLDDILSGRAQTPETWRRIKMKVIFKKGDPHMPKNYRPISILPVMAKLYSTVIYQRLQPILDAQLADEQFGFRKGRGCSDAIHILRQVIEKSAEWGEQLWVATLDVEKAFDRVHHSCLFEALLCGEVDVCIVSALRRLYFGMQATVLVEGGGESRYFDVQRGVRQGDPLSPLLFNFVLHQTLQEVNTIWKRRGYGTNVGLTLGGHRLTHVAFADDMTLISRSRLSMKRMLESLRVALSDRGLSLHPSKCKLQTNDMSLEDRGSTLISDGFVVEFLERDRNLELLGTSLSLADVTGQEIEHRIASAWRMFWGMKPLLLNQRASIRRRLRLFDATVGSCVTWCCESWSPRATELRQLESARRAMLRKIVGARRALEEEWLDWIKRATHKALSWASRTGVRDWSRWHHQRKWAWAGHVARSPANTWLYRVSTWRDSDWQAFNADSGTLRLLRPSTRRWMRWEDTLRRFCATWQQLAQDREAWAARSPDFLAHVRLTE